MSDLTKRILDVVDEAKLEQLRRLKDAAKREDLAAEIEARRSVTRIGALKEDLERAGEPARRVKGKVLEPSTGGAELFLDTPSAREKRIDRMLLHFRHAEYLFLILKPRGLPTPRELIWILLQDAMRTERAVPDQERRKLSSIRSLMPATRVTDSQAFATERERRSSDMSPFDDKVVRSTVTPADVDRMVDVLDLVRLVDDRERDRLRRVVLAYAAGLNIQQCGRIWDKHRVGFDRRAMHDLKQRFIGQILAGMEKHFGLVRTSRGFRRLTVREIEKRSRSRKAAERRASNDDGEYRHAA